MFSSIFLSEIVCILTYYLPPGTPRMPHASMAALHQIECGPSQIHQCGQAPPTDPHPMMLSILHATTTITSARRTRELLKFHGSISKTLFLSRRLVNRATNRHSPISLIDTPKPLVHIIHGRHDAYHITPHI